MSRNGGNHGGSFVYQRLRERGYEVFAVSPNADRVEGDACLSRPERLVAGDPSSDRGFSTPGACRVWLPGEETLASPTLQK